MSIKSFESTYTDCPSGAKLFSYHRVGTGESSLQLPLLVLMHGFPQSSLMWKHFVDEIPSEWSVLIPDLPGYGNSTKPVSPDGSALAHSKKEWAKDIVYVVDTLYGAAMKVIAYGHDRGARLAYRLALDFPGRIVGAALLDIVPTSFVWDAMRLEKGHNETRRSHHWIFLSTPRPLPETLIGANPEFYLNYKMRDWVGRNKRGAVLEWVTDSILPYVDPQRGPDRIAAACEDYRAGATHDIHDDYAASINPLIHSPLSSPPSPPPFTCPLLVLTSHHLRSRFDVDAIWHSLGAPGCVQSFQIGDEEIGHFLVNEAQAETGQRTRDWLGTFWLQP